MSRLAWLGPVIAWMAACTAPAAGRDRAERPGARESDVVAAPNPATTEARPSDLAPPSGLAMRPAGSLTLAMANDILARKDGGFTAGIGLTWTSPDAAACGPKSLARRLQRTFSFLPTVGDAPFRNFVQLTFAGEMYTPADITVPDPPPGSQPYAGLWYGDLSVYSKARRKLHEFTLRLGFVGPLAHAEQVQTWVHKRTNSPRPEGWDTQLGNEIFFNLFYQFHTRLVRSPRAPVAYDLTLNTGGGLGTYYVGANLGVVLRLGFHLPDTFGDGTLQDRPAWLVGLERHRDRYSDERLFGYAFLAADGSVVGRFLPTDGNTFKNSRSGDRETTIGAIITGVVIGIDHWLLTFTWKIAGDPIRPVSSNDDFGVVTLSYLF